MRLLGMHSGANRTASSPSRITLDSFRVRLGGLWGDEGLRRFRGDPCTCVGCKHPEGCQCNPIEITGAQRHNYRLERRIVENEIVILLQGLTIVSKSMKCWCSLDMSSEIPPSISPNTEVQNAVATKHPCTIFQSRHQSNMNLFHLLWNARS